MVTCPLGGGNRGPGRSGSVGKGACCRCEAPSSIPSTHGRLGMAAHIYNLCVPPARRGMETAESWTLMGLVHAGELMGS